MARTRAQAAAKGANGPADLIGTAAAAQELGVSQATLRRWLKEARVKGHKVGKQWRFRRSDLGSVVETHEAEPTPPPARIEQQGEPPATPRAGERSAGSGLELGEASPAIEELESCVAGYVKGSDPQARRLLAALVLQSVRNRASDLHIEPLASGVKLRYRIDGVLYEMMPPARELAKPLIEEVKRWAALDPREWRRPQDGRMLLALDGREVDIRVSTMPAIHGNVVTLRILDRAVQLPAAAALGFEPDQLERYRRIVHRPNGLILVTGPSGCGRTTTLYATLAELNTARRKIMTAEDPVEYDFEGINQSQINETIGFGYAQAARHMLRQAANILFIGEVRDREIGEILCQAAITGHLVFSTLHTDDVVGAVLRLIDMGVKPFLIASSIQCVLAQRLVRVICANCKAEHRPGEELLDALGLVGDGRAQSFHRGEGCERCGGTGYRGRVAVYELLEFNREVRDAVVAQEADGLAQAARSVGCRALREVALAKALRGETTLEEVAAQTVSIP